MFLEKFDEFSFLAPHLRQSRNVDHNGLIPDSEIQIFVILKLCNDSIGSYLFQSDQDHQVMKRSINKPVANQVRTWQRREN